MLYLHNDSTQINSGCANRVPTLLHVVKGNILGFLAMCPFLQNHLYKRNWSAGRAAQNICQMFLLQTIQRIWFCYCWSGAQNNDLFLSMKARWTTRNAPLDWFGNLFQQTIGDPAQFLQLADLKVDSLLLYKTNRAEQRQLDCPTLGLWTGP